MPKPAHDGNSKYVSQDVYNAVQSMQAALLETFAAGNRIVGLPRPDDVEKATVCRLTRTIKSSEPMMVTSVRVSDFGRSPRKGRRLQSVLAGVRGDR